VSATNGPLEARGTDDDLFEQLRPELFGLAYRMLGSVVDAEDIVAEAYLRWRAARRDYVQQPRAYLATVVARLSIDALTSARSRRESYVGPWLPEPLLTNEPGPAEITEMSDSLSLAFLVLLEELSPAARAAFLLHDVFGYGYPEVADALGRAQPACRQLVARARKDLNARRRISHKATPGAEYLSVDLNRQPGVVAVHDGVAVAAAVLDVADGLVCGVRVMANPEKLRALTEALGRRRPPAPHEIRERTP
jgi:RNA polymerase sigma factor (sigma-70 family)